MQKESQVANGTADREILLSRIVNAPRELVWQAMTNPHHIVHWWGPIGFSTTVEEMDVRPGGVWNQVMHGPDGANYPSKSVFTEVVKPERICFSQAGRKEGGPGMEHKSTWLFEALEENKTKVTIYMVFPSAEAREMVVREFGAIEGAKQTLERLSQYLQKMAVADSHKE